MLVLITLQKNLIAVYPLCMNEWVQWVFVQFLYEFMMSPAKK